MSFFSLFPLVFFVVDDELTFLQKLRDWLGLGILRREEVEAEEGVGGGDANIDMIWNRVKKKKASLVCK